MAGVPTRVIKEMAGHASITTTERYMHLAPGSTQEAVRKLEQLSSGLGRILVAAGSAWPQVARDPKAAPSYRSWARKLDAKPKYVVSTTRRDFPWSNTHRVEWDLTRAVRALKRATPRGLLVGSPMLSAELLRLGLVDEYRLVVHPVVAGHGPYLLSGLQPSLRLELVATRRLESGILALHYRRR
jgi:dihydrofolate reductase